MNNYTDIEIEHLKALEFKYLGFGKEVGTHGTPHLQGVAIFASQKTTSAAIKYFNLPRVHIELCKGTIFDNIKYCSKNGDYYEQGTRPMDQEEKGKAGKEIWERTITLAESGDFTTIREENPQLYFHHLKTIQYHRTNAAKKPAELEKFDNFWLWGTTGTGKTLTVKHKYFGKPIYWKDPHNKWWDGYNGEEIVVFDDLDKKKAQDYMGEMLKRWCGNEPFLAECKGGNTRYIRPKTMIVTCNWSPKEIWEEEQHLEPIERRFKVKNIIAKGKEGIEQLILKYKWKKVMGELLTAH